MNRLGLTLAVVCAATLPVVVQAPAHAADTMRPLVAVGFAEEPDGRMLFLKNCRTCHGATGVPSSENKKKYPKMKEFTDPTLLGGVSDDSILTVLKNGKGKDMKAWGSKLSDEEMVAVVKYVRVLAAAKK